MLTSWNGNGRERLGGGMGWLHAARRGFVEVLREAMVVVVRWEVKVEAEAEVMVRVRVFGRGGCGILWLRL
jgi:hypothetical protein